MHLRLQPCNKIESNCIQEWKDSRLEWGVKYLISFFLIVFLLQCGIHLDKPISRSGWTRRSRKRGIGFGAFDHQHGAWRASLDCRHCSHSWSWYCSHQFAWWKATHASKRWFLSWSIRPYLRGLQHVIFLILLLAINAKLCSILFRTNFKSLQSIDEKTNLFCCNFFTIFKERAWFFANFSATTRFFIQCFFYRHYYSFLHRRKSLRKKKNEKKLQYYHYWSQFPRW